MFATDTMLGVKPSDTYKFLIILSPTGPYYAAPMKIAVEEKIYPGRSRWRGFFEKCRELWR